jgi:hypothetical protein
MATSSEAPAEASKKRVGGPHLPLVGSRKASRAAGTSHPSAAHTDESTYSDDDPSFQPIAVSGQDIVEEPEVSGRNVPDEEDIILEQLSLADIIRRPVTEKKVVQEHEHVEAADKPDELRRSGLPVVRPAASSRPRTEPISTIDTDPAMALYTDDPYALQVKIGADGRIIIDQASQSIAQPEVAEGPQRIVIEGGRNHITSATYARRPRADKWKQEEVELLYEALSQCGTDFSLIEVFFPTRTRAHVKARFKREEKDHPERVNAALRNKRPIDVEYFKELIAIKKAVQAGGPPPLGVASATRPAFMPPAPTAPSTSAPRTPVAAPSVPQAAPEIVPIPAHVEETSTVPSKSRRTSSSPPAPTAPKSPPASDVLPPSTTPTAPPMDDEEEDEDGMGPGSAPTAPPDSPNASES